MILTPDMIGKANKELGMLQAQIDKVNTYLVYLEQKGAFIFDVRSFSTEEVGMIYSALLTIRARLQREQNAVLDPLEQTVLKGKLPV